MVGLGGYTTVPAPSTSSLRPWVQRVGHMSEAARNCGSDVQDSISRTRVDCAIGKLAWLSRLEYTWQNPTRQFVAILFGAIPTAGGCHWFGT
jgi:hypothetical protein